MIFTGQEQLTGTYHASVAEARSQLLALEATLRGQLYASYVEQCLAMSPEFRERGRRVGDRILTQLLAVPAASRLSQVKYCDVADAKAAAAPAVQLDGSWLHGSSSMNSGDISGSYDSALAMLDGLAQPLLDPFVEGLKEPFVQAVRDYQTKMQSTVTLAAASGLAGGIAAGLVLGFLIGRFAGSSGGGNHNGNGRN
jgi:hypothetical protein